MVISLIYPARFVCVTDGIVHTGQSLTYHSVFDSLEFINEPNNFRKIESPPPNTLIESSVCCGFLSFWACVSSRECEFSGPTLSWHSSVLLSSLFLLFLLLLLFPHHHSSPSLTLCTSKCACVACFLCVSSLSTWLHACMCLFLFERRMHVSVRACVCACRVWGKAASWVGGVIKKENQ